MKKAILITSATLLLSGSVPEKPYTVVNGKVICSPQYTCTQTATNQMKVTVKK